MQILAQQDLVIKVLSVRKEINSTVASNNPRGRKWKTLSKCLHEVRKSHSLTFSRPLVSGCCCTSMRPPTKELWGFPWCKSATFFMLQMMESHHFPLANTFGMAVCSSHDMFFISSGPKIPRKQTKTFFFFFLNYSHFFDTERKKEGFVFLILTGFSFPVTPSWKRLILMNCIA